MLSAYSDLFFKQNSALPCFKTSIYIMYRNAFVHKTKVNLSVLFICFDFLFTRDLAKGYFDLWGISFRNSICVVFSSEMNFMQSPLRW